MLRILILESSSYDCYEKLYLDEIPGAASMSGMDVLPDMGPRSRWSSVFRLGLGAEEEEEERSRVARFEEDFLKRFWLSLFRGHGFMSSSVLKFVSI